MNVIHQAKPLKTITPWFGVYVITLGLCLLSISSAYGVARIYWYDQELKNDTLKAELSDIMLKAKRLDTTLKSEDFTIAFNMLNSSHKKKVISYDKFVKELVFDERFSLDELSGRLSRKLLRKMSIGFCSQYYRYLTFKQKDKVEKAKKAFELTNELALSIESSGSGEYDNPYLITSFYDAYFFVISKSGTLPGKGDFFMDESGNVIGAFEVYIAQRDEIVHYYFNINFLKEYYAAEINMRDKNLHYED
jgi:hypothetical protein